MKKALIIFATLAFISCAKQEFKEQTAFEITSGKFQPLPTGDYCPECPPPPPPPIKIDTNTYTSCCEVFDNDGNLLSQCVSVNGDCKECFVWCAENQE